MSENNGFQANQGDELLPELNCFFLSGSRHDKDRIEIQIGFDGLVPKGKGQFVYDVDCMVFSPRTLGLSDIEDTELLRQEFQSYIRLHSHVTNPESETSLQRVKERLIKLKNNLNSENLRFFAIEIEGALKGHSKRIKQHRHELPALAHEIEIVEYLIRDFRSVLIAKDIEQKNADDFLRGTLEHDILLLNEYLSHLYTQYLAGVFHICREAEINGPVFTLVQNALKEESRIRSKHLYLIEQRRGPQSSELEDQYLRRVSLLKKYFQSTLFVKVKGETLQKSAILPVYGIAAALAASFAIIVSIYQVTTLVQRVGINSVAFISVGVAAYVIKDLMKDYFRRYFFKTTSYFLPDFKKKLYIVTGKKSKKLGQIREYIRLIENTKLSPEIRKLRYSVAGGEIEEHLNEDILHFKKRVILNLEALGMQSGFPWGVREIIRYRYDRLLISMEDPYKNMTLLSETGIPANRLGHRIYHTYIFTKISLAPEMTLAPQIKAAFKVYRVTLDKTGVLDCKQLKFSESLTPHNLTTQFFNTKNKN